MKKYYYPIRIVVQIALVLVIASYAFLSCNHAPTTTLDSNIVGSNAKYEVFTFYNYARDTQSYSIFFSVLSVNAGTYFVYTNNSLQKLPEGEYAVDFVHNWAPYDLIIPSNSQVDSLVYFNFLSLYECLDRFFL